MSTTSISTLAALEHRMSELCARRREIVSSAETAIKRANRDFDRAALPLASKITQLREQLESDSQIQSAPPLDAGSLDPEWSQEDRDHYIELRRRATNGR